MTALSSPLFGLIALFALGPASESAPPSPLEAGSHYRSAVGPLVMAGHVPERMTVYADAEEPSILARKLRESVLLGHLSDQLSSDLMEALGAVSQSGIKHAGLGFDFSFLRQKASFVLLLASDQARTLTTVLRARIKQPGIRVFRSGLFVAIADSPATQRAVGRCARGEAKALLDNPGFRKFLTSEPSSALRFRADLNRLFPLRPGVAAPKDAGAALVATHLLWMAGRGRVIEGSVKLENGLRVEVNTRMPRLSEDRRFIEAKSTPLPPLQPNTKSALRATFTRDLSAFWQNVDVLLPEAARPGLAEFRSTASLLLGGIAVDDFIAGLGHGIELHIGELPKDHSPVRHRFPTAAVVVELKDERLRTELMISFQEVIGAINLQASMDGKPRYLLGTRDHKGSIMLTARFLPALLPDKDDDRKQVEITMAQVGTRVILGSHSSIVAALADAATHSKLSSSSRGDHLHLDSEDAVSLLEDSKGFLVGRLALEVPGGRAQVLKRFTTAKAILSQSQSLDLYVTALGEKARVILDIKAPSWWERLSLSEEKK